MSWVGTTVTCDERVETAVSTDVASLVVVMTFSVHESEHSVMVSTSVLVTYRTVVLVVVWTEASVTYAVEQGTSVVTVTMLETVWGEQTSFEQVLMVRYFVDKYVWVVIVGVVVGVVGGEGVGVGVSVGVGFGVDVGVRDGTITVCVPVWQVSFVQVVTV